MLTPEVPPDDKQRVAALHNLNLLDTQAEERFDRYTRLVKRLLKVPIALISLVDSDRQWFKSKQGLEVSETDRDISFCAHTILRDEIMVVEDTRRDPRFIDNPLVTGNPGIRFYAGCPLREPGGQKVGTLCIVDHEPRTLDPEDLEILRDLSTLVAGEMVNQGVATTDAFTGLSNRQGFELLISKARDTGETHASACLVLIDIASFRNITRRFGDAAGLHTVKAFSKLILDAFGDAAIIAREGDDRFVAYITDSVIERPGYLLRKLQDGIDVFNAQPGQEYPLAFYSCVVPYRSGDTMDAVLIEAKNLISEQKKVT